MKLSKTGLRILSARYRSVLKKCFLINMGIFAFVGQAMATTISLGNGETRIINGDTDSKYAYSCWKVDLANSDLQNDENKKMDFTKTVAEIAEDLKNITNVRYSYTAADFEPVSKVDLNGATLTLDKARIDIDPSQNSQNEDGSIDAIFVKDSTIKMNNSSLDASTDKGDQKFNTVFSNATLELVKSELPIDGEVAFTNKSSLSISSPDYFSEEEIIAIFQNDENAQKIAEAVQGNSGQKFLPDNIDLAYTNSDGTSGVINTDKIQVEQAIELKRLIIDDSKLILGEEKADNDRARISSDSQIFIQNNSNVVLNSRTVMTFDNSESDGESTYGQAELLVDHSHVTLNDNAQLNVKNGGNAKTTIRNNSQIFMNDNSQMNLNTVEMENSQIHMKDNAILTMDSVTLTKAAIHGTGTNKIIIAGENATTFEDTSLEITDSDAIQVNKNGHFKIQAKNNAVSITGNSAETSTILLEGENGNLTTVEIDGGTQSVTIDGAIISANKDNVLNLSGNVKLNGLLDPLTANISDGKIMDNYYADDIAFNLNNNGTLKYSDDKYLYDTAKHRGKYALNSINFNGGTLDVANGKTTDIKLAKLTLTKDSNIMLDADLANETMDRFTEDTPVEGSAKLNISQLNLISDAKNDETTINFTQDEKLLAAVDYTGKTSGLKALSPIYTYDVAYDNTNGDFTFTRGSGSNVSDYNPSVYAASVAGHTVDFLQYNIANTAFNALSSYNAAQQGLASGDMPKANNAWVSVIGFDDNVDFDKFQTVDSEIMSVIGGVTSDRIQTSLGDTTYGIYAGYLDGEQKYNGNKLNQKGGYIGLGSEIRNNETVVQGTINTGFIGNEDKHSFGNDKFDTYWTGVALKGGYDYKLNDTTTITPNIYTSYTFVNSEDYTSKSGARIKNDNLHLWEIAPGIKANKSFTNGWNGFIQAKYAIVMDNGGDATVDSIALPNISTKNYVEYGIGADKDLNDAWSLSAEINRRDGGREGWNGNLNIKYNF